MTAAAGRKRTRRKSQKPYPCEGCTKGFDNQRDLDEHRRVYSKHACDQCSAHYNYRSGLMTHKDDMHGDPTLCDICGADMGRKDNHTRHKERFHETGPWFWCGYPGCDRNEYSEFNMKKHMSQPHHPSHVGKVPGELIRGEKTAEEKAVDARMSSNKPSSDTKQEAVPSTTSLRRHNTYADAVKQGSRLATPQRQTNPAPQPGFGFQDLQSPPPPVVIRPSSPLYSEASTGPPWQGTAFEAPSPRVAGMQHTAGMDSQVHSADPMSAQTSFSVQDPGNNDQMDNLITTWTQGTPLVGNLGPRKAPHPSTATQESPWIMTAQTAADEQAIVNRGGTRSEPRDHQFASFLPARTFAYSRTQPGSRHIAKRQRSTNSAGLLPIPDSSNSSSSHRSQLLGEGNSHGIFSASQRAPGWGISHQLHGSGSSVGRRSDAGQQQWGGSVHALSGHVEAYLTSRQGSVSTDRARMIIQDFLVFATCGGNASRPTFTSQPQMVDASASQPFQLHTSQAAAQGDQFPTTPALTLELDTDTNRGMPNEFSSPVDVYDANVFQSQPMASLGQTGLVSTFWPDIQPDAPPFNPVAVEDFQQDVDNIADFKHAPFFFDPDTPTQN